MPPRVSDDRPREVPNSGDENTDVKELSSMPWQGEQKESMEGIVLGLDFASGHGKYCHRAQGSD